MGLRFPFLGLLFRGLHFRNYLQTSNQMKINTTEIVHCWLDRVTPNVFGYFLRLQSKKQKAASASEKTGRDQT